MTIHIALSIQLLFIVATLGACATAVSLSDVDEPDFDTVVERYLSMDGSKALALATEANGRFAWAIAAKETSEADATATAIDRCRRAARSGGMRADCIAFAVGDGPAPDTIEGCAARRLTSRRCEMQRSHQGRLGR